MTKYIVVVDDDENLLNSFRMMLMTYGFTQLKLFSSSVEAIDFIGKNEVSVVLADINMPDINGVELLKKIKEINPLIEVVMVTAVTDSEIIVETIKNGAYDYLVKPIDEMKLVSTIRNAIGVNELKIENENLNALFLQEGLKRTDIYEQIITRDGKMLKIFKYIEAISKSSQPVLITGETGTGKELIAHAIHHASDSYGEFIHFNVAGIEDDVFSEKLFGKVETNSNGKIIEKRGYLEKATDGTIFIDEIADLPIESQIKLLRLLQEESYFPVKSNDAKKLKCRVIVATNRNLKELIKEGVFRDDLYFRLKTHHIVVPPLRDRKVDIKPLLMEYLPKICRKQNKKTLKYGKKFIDILQSYDYPGNVREFISLLSDIINNSEDGEINTEYARSLINLNMDKNVAVEVEDVNYFNFNEDEFPTLKEVTDALVMKALKRAAGNQSLASRLLGVTRQALNQRLKKYPYLLNEFSEKKEKIVKKRLKK